MRKVKALELMAAATLAAVPTVAFAADESAGSYRRPTVSAQPTANPYVFDLNSLYSGQFRLARPSLVGGPDADGTFTWVGPDEGSWLDPANWLPAGGPPTGNAAIATINNLNGGGVVQMNGAVTLSNLNLTDPQIAGVGGPQSGASVNMTMAGNRQISASQITQEAFPFTGTFFGAAVGLPSVAGPPALPARPINIAGSSGLVYDGLGAAGLSQTGKTSIRFGNSYTGNTTISNGAQVTLLNQVGMNAAFGANNADDIVLNRGKIWVEVDNGLLDRDIVVSGTGNNLSLGTDPANAGTSTHTFNGVISGSGRLLIDGDFGGIGNFTAANTYSGIVDVGLGTQNFSGSGGFASASTVNNAASIELQGAGNRLPDAGAHIMHAGSLRMMNYNGTETVGSTTIRGGTSAIIMQGGSGQYASGAFTRQNKGGLEIQANGLGSTNKVTFSSGMANVAGVVPFAFGHAQDPFINGIESQFTEALTYDATNGLTPISAAGGYSENVYAAGTHVRLQSDTLDEAFAVPGGTTTINSLVMAAGFDGGGNGVNGLHVSGNGVLNVSSGLVLSANSGFTPTNAINSGVGNVVDAGVTITSPTSELVLACPGAMTFNGTIADGPADNVTGMTKIGIRTLFMNSTTNSYTGETVLSGFNRHKGNLPNNANSAYGNASSAIVLDGNNRIQNDPGLGATGIFGVSFGPDATNTGPTTMDRPLLVRANEGRNLIISQIRNFSAFSFTMNGPITIESGADLSFVSLNAANQPYFINSNISGPGHVTVNNLQAGVTVTLAGNNTHSGGTDISSAAGNATPNVVNVNSDTAFGTGQLVISMGGGGTAELIGNAPRTIANQTLMAGGTFRIGGTQPFNFTGNVIAGGSVLDVNAGNSLTFSGNLSGSDMFKVGDGVLNLTGANTIDGQINAGNGSIAGGMIVMRSNGAAGSDVGVTAANAGNNAIALAGGVTVGSDSADLGTDGELMVMRGDGIGGLGNLRNLSGNNTWNGDVLIQEQTGLNTSGTIGVDNGGDTMTVTGAVFSSATNTSGTPAVNLAFNKVGPGTLVVGSNTFTGVGSGTFRGSVLTSGNFNIAAGNVRFSNVTADSHTYSVADVPSLSIAGGPGSATSKLDIGKNAMVIDHSGTSPLADIRAFIVQGYAGGSWTGNGITSSDANATIVGIGYVENSGENQSAGTTGKTDFFGNPVDNTAVLIAWVPYGDANLDNLVNLSDFNRVAANFGTAAGAVWGQGDFDYNGNVNLTDFNRLAANFGFSASPGGPTPEDWAHLATLVPEPSALGLAAVAGVALLKRRRREVH
jgi:hypothetical protein